MRWLLVFTGRSLTIFATPGDFHTATLPLEPAIPFLGHCAAGNLRCHGHPKSANSLGRNLRYRTANFTPFSIARGNDRRYKGKALTGTRHRPVTRKQSQRRSTHDSDHNQTVSTKTLQMSRCPSLNKVRLLSLPAARHSKRSLMPSTSPIVCSSWGESCHTLGHSTARASTAGTRNPVLRFGTSRSITCNELSKAL